MAAQTPWTRRFAAVALAVTALLGAAPVLAEAAAPPVTVFAAASLKNAMDDVIAAFTARTHTPARASYGASSALARQIEQGAPAEVFVSADTDWMDYLAKKVLITPDSRHNLLTNHLALIAPAGSTVKLKIAKGMALAAALGPDRLAMAGPEVPAGRYGKASLTALGVWPEVKDHVARAENVRSALAFVARGETPLGIVYDTDAEVEPKVRIVGLFPDDSHAPILYPAAAIGAAPRPQALALLKFLQGAEARRIFAHYGFQSPPKG